MLLSTPKDGNWSFLMPTTSKSYAQDKKFNNVVNVSQSICKCTYDLWSITDFT